MKNKEVKATIGNGLKIEKSKIKGAGYGVIADMCFEKNDYITAFSGKLIYREAALKLREKRKDSHVRVLNAHFSFIDGIRRPIKNMGAASLANDKAFSLNGSYNPRKNNTEFFAVERGCLKTIVLKAKRNIKIGEELYVTYGENYWIMKEEGEAARNKAKDVESAAGGGSKKRKRG
jgi:hypothetical protein